MAFRNTVSSAASVVCPVFLVSQDKMPMVALEMGLGWAPSQDPYGKGQADTGHGCGAMPSDFQGLIPRWGL